MKPFVDGQIAAIAHANGLVLVSGNEKDFTDFKGLTIQNWPRARHASSAGYAPLAKALHTRWP